MHRKTISHPDDLDTGVKLDYLAICTYDIHKKMSIGPVDQIVEAASTIKIPVFIMACERNECEAHTLNFRLQRRAHHSSNGSGVLEWAGHPGEYYTVRELLFSMISISDCVATNMLIDYVGGQDSVNSWLEKHHLKTRLIMPYINFTKSDDFESVGVTTATELSMLSEIVMTSPWHDAYKRLAKAATSTLLGSWVGDVLPSLVPGIQGKTGSMLYCPPHNVSYLNFSGCFQGGDSMIFCSMVASAVTEDDAVLASVKSIATNALADVLNGFLTA